MTTSHILWHTKPAFLPLALSYRKTDVPQSVCRRRVRRTWVCFGLLGLMVAVLWVPPAMGPTWYSHKPARRRFSEAAWALAFISGSFLDSFGAALLSGKFLTMSSPIGFARSGLCMAISLWNRSTFFCSAAWSSAFFAVTFCAGVGAGCCEQPATASAATIRIMLAWRMRSLHGSPKVPV